MKSRISKGIFAGGDCVTGPATVIRAIAAGKVAAANIDEYLGFHHQITSDVEIPYAGYEDKEPCGRVEVALRDACRSERKTLSQSNMVFHVKKRVRNQDAVYDVTILVSVHSEEAEKKNGKFKD